jgi:hypothetical protein
MVINVFIVDLAAILKNDANDATSIAAPLY